MPTTRTKGNAAEDRAVSALRERGYTIHERNWRLGEGEIDIVAHEGGDWVFVEVRASYDGIDAALESVGKGKQGRLRRLAAAYLAAHDLGEVAHRIDLVVIDLKTNALEILTHAVGW
ncbi:MAG TPA: YraN family protein [Aggregatilineales bacterium]|nr:YraN family protein [Anaerolineales bacterium]HRE49100.1 YraN family protein [Aggregatilineales bacterium]